MKRALLLLWLTYPGLTWAQAPVRYAISFEQADHHEAEVQVTFSEWPRDTLEVRMSRSSPGRYALHEFAKNVYAVRAVDGGGQPLTIVRPNPHQWNVVGHDGTVTVRYTVFGDRCDGTYLAIDNTHAHLNMPATFMWARGLERRPIEITFHKPNPDWRVATQLVPSDRPDTFTAPDLDYFMDSPTEVGAFQLREWQVNSDGVPQSFRLALHHEGTEAEADAYARMCQAVVAEEIALYQQAPRFDYGTYTFIADYLPYANGDGMEHRNSTILTSRRALAEGAIRNLNTVAHEFFHAWNVERMRPRSLEPFNFETANMSGELWFAEGFTSYYDGLILKRAGLISLDRFVEEVGRTLNSVLHAPGRRYFSPVEMSQRAPFTDAATFVDPKNERNVFISYYPYGAAIALGLDLTLRQGYPGLTLDDYMRAVWQRHGAQEIPYTNEDLRRILGEVTGDPVFADEFFARFVYGRELMDYEGLLAAAGLVLRRAHPGEAWLGPLDFEPEGASLRVSRPTIIGSPLYEAGVDRGDVLVSLNGDSLASLEQLEELIHGFQPGDTVTLIFEKRGEERIAQLTFAANPELEVVPVEHLGETLSETARGFRTAWLRQQSTFDVSALRKHCPKCRRSFAFEFEYCRYDGEQLGITPSPR